MVKRYLKVKLIFIAFLITIILLIYLFNSNAITESIDKPIFLISYNLEIPNPIETPEIKADMISVEAIKCTRKSTSNYQIDLRIKNLGFEKASVEFYPSGTIVNLSPGDIKIVDLFGQGIERKLTAISDGSKNYEVDIPSCTDESGSDGSNGITQTLVPSLSPINSIPEFPWIGLPVIFVTLLVFLFRRN